MSSGLKYFLAFVLAILISGCKPSDKEVNESEESLVEIVVNPAIDLFSLMSRLAGINQYTEVLLPDYITEVENHFDPYRDHPGIAFARECNAIHQINGDAPMSLAVYVGPPPELKMRMDLSHIPASFDPRWDSALISEYLEHARIFARESKFMEFHQSQQAYQDLAKQNLYEMISKEQIFQWYKKFFGYFPENFKMYLALLNGSCNYGYPVFYPHGKEEFVSLLGGRFPDKEGFPTYPKEWFLPVVIHEYMHSYINPLIKARPEEFREPGEALLHSHREKMIESGYNVWNVIIQEYIVRACTVKYLEETEGRTQARNNIKNDLRAGFSEIEGLVGLLSEYENSRDIYPDIDSFLPQIKAYFVSCLGD